MLSFKPFLEEVERLYNPDEPILETSDRLEDISSALRKTMTEEDYTQLLGEIRTRFASRKPFERLGLYYSCLNWIRGETEDTTPPRIQTLFEIGYGFMKPMRNEKLFNYFQEAFAAFEDLLVSDKEIKLAQRDIDEKFERSLARVLKEQPGLYPQDF